MKWLSRCGVAVVWYGVLCFTSHPSPSCTPIQSKPKSKKRRRPSQGPRPNAASEAVARGATVGFGSPGGHGFADNALMRAASATTAEELRRLHMAQQAAYGRHPHPHAGALSPTMADVPRPWVQGAAVVAASGGGGGGAGGGAGAASVPTTPKTPVSKADLSVIGKPSPGLNFQVTQGVLDADRLRAADASYASIVVVGGVRTCTCS